MSDFKNIRLSTRLAILLQLNSARPVSLTESALEEGLKIAELFRGQKNLLAELDFLELKNFIESFSNELSQSSKRYKLTLTGVEYLEKEGY